jgi:hypothetical protein
MSAVFGTKHGVRARTRKLCFWCGEAIEPGDLFDQWTWVDRHIERIQVHPECREAWSDAAAAEGGYYETMPYDHERGA